MYLRHITTNLAAGTRAVNFDGRDYIVCPMTMITVGVLNGSQGAVYYPAEELAKVPAVWNTKPVVVYHPFNGSATDPNELERRAIGMIMNATFKGNKLTAEAWIDPVKADRIDNRIMAAIENGKVLEVSTGLFTDSLPTRGEYNGKAYDAIAYNYRPDHLAILPDKIGACSVADGCGLMQLNEAKPLGLPKLTWNDGCDCERKPMVDMTPSQSTCHNCSTQTTNKHHEAASDAGRAKTGGDVSPLGLPSMDW